MFDCIGCCFCACVYERPLLLKYIICWVKSSSSVFFLWRFCCYCHLFYIHVCVCMCIYGFTDGGYIFIIYSLSCCLLLLCKKKLYLVLYIFFLCWLGPTTTCVPLFREFSLLCMCRRSGCQVYKCAHLCNEMERIFILTILWIFVT